MGDQKGRQKLRGKTGCLGCRTRRKKCDETTPTCNRCSASGRVCEWPTSNQLVDRRYASHPRSRHSTSSPGGELAICSRSAGTAHSQLLVDLEVVVSRHFVETYYDLLLLPNCHREFYNGWIREIKQLMAQDGSLRFSVLANAAAHMHNGDSNPGMQSLALKYYSKAIKGLSATLEQASDTYLASSDDCLMSMMFLYIHGCMGRGTYNDIPPHLQAAMRVITLRLFNKSQVLQSPFDILALESVLYQIFLGGTGLWTDEVPPTDFSYKFWFRAEKMLEASRLVPNSSTSINSPVLGVPVPLIRLAVQAKHILQHPEKHIGMLDKVRDETKSWEAIVQSGQAMDPFSDLEVSNREQSYYESSSYLYVIIISLLVEQATENASAKSQFPRPVSRGSWQLQTAFGVLRRHESDSGWDSCYMANWCIYTLGFMVEEPEDIQLIRNEIWKRWEATKFMQNTRFMEDLEKTWATRQRVCQAIVAEEEHEVGSHADRD